jgi:hypothetical protein
VLVNPCTQSTRASAAHRRGIDVQQHAKAGLIAVGLGADHGPLARYLALAADALIGRRFGVLVVGLRPKAAGPVVRAGTLGAVLAKLGADLLFLLVSHQAWQRSTTKCAVR